MSRTLQAPRIKARKIIPRSISQRRSVVYEVTRSPIFYGRSVGVSLLLLAGCLGIAISLWMRPPKFITYLRWNNIGSSALPFLKSSKKYEEVSEDDERFIDDVPVTDQVYPTLLFKKRK